MDWQQPMEHLKWLAYNLAIVSGAVILAFVAHLVAVQILSRLCRRTQSKFDEIAVARCSTPTRWMAMIAAVWLVLDLTTLSPGATAFVRHLASVTLLALTAWLLIRVLRVARDIFLSRHILTEADNLRARAVHTQVKVLERILITVIVVITFGCLLMTFDGVRQLGVSLLASAGIVGIILGLAAQRMLGTLLAGLQLALTQPIRLDDVVIVEGEWGRIEEITLTYVVVRIWDRRRLVVPITYFMEKPFQNWTRVSADILGTVYCHLDVTVPVEAIRQELHRLLKDSPQWDGQVWGLQVTNLNERTMELRALMGARNASDAWDLRCRIREGLMEYIKTHHPEALPRLRIEETGRGTDRPAALLESPA